MRLRAVYTVEAAWIMSICLLVIGGAITMAYRIYDSSLLYIESTAPAEFDAALRFREISVGKEIAESIFGRK